MNMNAAEIELNALIRQCLNIRIDNIDESKEEIYASQKLRNNLNAKINWQFTPVDARLKLKKLYPTLNV
jgi:hypothetical protein